MISIPFSISLSFFLSAIFAAIVSKMGYRIVLLDKTNERSSHSQPTPRGGGVGIWIALMLIGFFGVEDIFFTLIGGSVGLLGLFEDRFTLSSKSRLIIQLGLSASVVYLFSGTPASVVAIAFFLFWVLFIAGTANFYNFMDGINGIAGLTGVVGFGLMAFFSFFIANKPDIVLFSIVLAVACLGFLPFNFPKARVFMGDENLMQAHRSHLYQYMSNELGYPHWKVSLLYAMTQLIVGALAIWAYQRNIVLQIVLVAGYGTLFLFSYKLIKAIKPKQVKQQVVRI